LCPDQDDIRLMLAEQLTKRERKAEALDQLQTLYEKFESEGRSAEARATVDRMKAIDPSTQPKASGTQRPQKSSDLVFLDVDYGDAKARPGMAPSRGGPARGADVPPKPSPLADLPMLDTGEATQPTAGAPAPMMDPGGASVDASLDPGGSSLLGLEPTTLGGGANAGPGGLLDLEPTSLSSGDPFAAGGGMDTGSGIVNFSSGFDEAPISRDDAASLLDGGLVEISLGDEQPTAAPPEHDLALPGQLPALDAGGGLDLIMPEGGGASLLGGLETTASYGADAGSAVFEPLDLDLQRDGAESLAGAGDVTGGLPMMDLGTSAEGPTLQPPAARSGAAPHSRAIDALRARVAKAPGDWASRRQLGEALFAEGERDAGLQELELTMIGYERAGDLDTASSVAEEIIRINPNSVRHHQKRVEYAFRTQDKARLVDAYLELADALFRSGQADKAKAVYQRVLELSPDHVRAQAALSAFIEPAAAPPPPKREPARVESGTFKRYAPGGRQAAPPAPPKPAPASTPAPPAAAAAATDPSFVNLGDWLRQDDRPKSTRMVVAEQAPTGDEQADFADMLRKFKHGVAQNVEDEDYQAHYDLGVAYKEMGLLDEAIAEFQKALRSTQDRVRAYEALGQCFLEKSQFQVAATILARALSETAADDDQLVGVLYLLGYACEGLHRRDEALKHYQRVFAVDIQFRDVSERISSLERQGK
ncbi:MAG TPA: tetratricopeptide repeat protein, partial [Gemmatimonadaceae bacterium]|nr:tetratricopeptide repeat protein [Gemmatimonadaceae bacterium]